MPPSLTREQVQSMASDASSVKSGLGLANGSKWQLLGANAEALWGECKGSGKNPYQTQIDLSTFTTRCSCPSRKFPCKHALGLMFLYADQIPQLSAQSEPTQWVAEWMEGRKTRAAKKEEKAANAKPVDPEKQAASIVKRKETRWKRIESGVQELQRWLGDQFTQGFASFSPSHYAHWENMAARMVDAQAPGLARMIREALSLMQSGSEHQQDAIEQLGLAQLLCNAALRRTELAPEKLADIQTALGWSLEKDEIQSTRTPITDHWVVLGQITEDYDTRLTERRTWLYGTQTKQYALLLDFAFKKQGGLTWSWVNQYTYEATLAYYPGSMPLRAILLEQNKENIANRLNFEYEKASKDSTAVRQSAADKVITIKSISYNQFPLPPYQLEESINYSSALLASNPWLVQTPVFLPDVLPLLHQDEWWVKTHAGYFLLNIHEPNCWNLMAFSAGEAIHLFAEWNGRTLRPLAAQHAKTPQKFWNHINPNIAV